ncbi:MAG: pyridoxamine 5'-phosphate oxidase family protein [Chloroflexi bacterium]|nr:MAG: pyridoxamine 5'-phosphate oxidase family protein [Chloroflexota bacterium]
MTIREQCPPDVYFKMQAFVEAQSTLVLATVTLDGHVQSAPLFFVSDADFDFYWLSSQNSEHSRNVSAHPQVAASIYPAVWQWKQIRGLQIEGAAQVVADAALRDKILALYHTKFDLPALFDQQIAASGLYMLRPTWLRWLDNSVAFGHRVEVGQHHGAFSSNHNVTDAESIVSPGLG